MSGRWIAFASPSLRMPTSVVTKRVIPSSNAVGRCDRPKLWFRMNIGDLICGGDGLEDKTVGDTFPDEVMAHVDVFRVAVMERDPRQ